MDKKALQNGLLPFQRKRVMCVAGLLLNYNNRSLFHKVVGTAFVSSFTSGRASWSYWNSVGVSCGGIALYRDYVVKQHLNDYLTQEVFGQKAKYGDDRMLTQYATLHGDTVYQENAIGYTLMPGNFNHLTRQRIRWWKSFWWGGLWVIKHQNISRGVGGLTLSQFMSFILYSVVFPFMMIVYPVLNREPPWAILLYMCLLSYLRTARTLLTKRAGVSQIRHVLEWIVLAPMSSMLNLYLCSVLQIVSLFKLKEVRGWGTQADVEVKMEESQG
ncbi:MAG: hypothetical protein ACK5L3_03830 [Oscillospiraceae bacterium]